MVRLKNKKIIAEISRLGAQLRSLCFENKEYLWCGDPEIWGFTSPLLFPVCGSLRDDKFIFEGKEYYLPKHGFAKLSTFKVEKQDSDSVVLLLKADDKTLEMYPFRFELRVIFTLRDNGIEVTYKIDNKDKKEMYFSIGSHEAYATPEGIEEYDVILSQKETLDTVLLDGSLLRKDTDLVIKDTNILPLKEEYFAGDSLIFKSINSKNVILKSRNNGRLIKVDFPNFPYFIIWHKIGAGFICLEPWCGLPDYNDSHYDITKKEGIIPLKPNEVYTVTHTITLG